MAHPTIKHLRSSVLPNGRNIRTACQRVVGPNSNWVASRDKVTCVECLENTHHNLSYEETYSPALGRRA